jgi:hypothetical protein
MASASGSGTASASVSHGPKRSHPGAGFRQRQRVRPGERAIGEVVHHQVAGDGIRSFRLTGLPQRPANHHAQLRLIIQRRLGGVGGHVAQGVFSAAAPFRNTGGIAGNSRPARAHGRDS